MLYKKIRDRYLWEYQRKIQKLTVRQMQSLQLTSIKSFLSDKTKIKNLTICKIIKKSSWINILEHNYRKPLIDKWDSAQMFKKFSNI